MFLSLSTLSFECSTIVFLAFQFFLCIYLANVDSKTYLRLTAIRMHVRNNVEEFPLVTKIQRHQSLTDAPFIEGIRDWEENVYQSAILMQTLIKSRAVQMMVIML